MSPSRRRAIGAGRGLASRDIRTRITRAARWSAAGPPASRPTAITPAKIARALPTLNPARAIAVRRCIPRHRPPRLGGRARCPHRAAAPWRGARLGIMRNSHAKFAHALPTATGRCGAMVGRHRPWGLPTLPARTRPLITPAKLAGALPGPPGTCRRSGEGGYFFICSRVRVAICSTVTSP